MQCDETERQRVIQNLLDAGCSEAFIREYLARPQAAQLRLLEQQRGALLERLHLAGRQLECLDYLRYQLQRNKIRKE